MYREYAQQLTSSIASLAAINKLTAKEQAQARTEEIQAGKTALSKAFMDARTDMAAKAATNREVSSEVRESIKEAGDEVTTKTSEEELASRAKYQVATEHMQSNIEGALAEGTKELTKTYQGIEDAYTSGKISAKRAMKELKTGYERIRKPVNDTIATEEAKWNEGGEATPEEIATRMADLKLQAAQREKERMNSARQSLTNAGFILPGGTR